MRLGAKLFSYIGAFVVLATACASDSEPEAAATPAEKPMEAPGAVPPLWTPAAEEVQATPVEAAPSESDDTGNDQIMDSTPLTKIEDDDGSEISIETEEFEQKNPTPVSSIQYIDFDTPIHVEAAREFDAESGGRYTATKKRLGACKVLPVDVVWQHFSPFFTYRWSPEFVKFSALFLAIWERESAFHPPRKAVHVNPNCKNRRSTLIKSLPAKSVRVDLLLGGEKLRKLQKYFPNCSLSRADFGPLQWNYHWRLSRKQYRKSIERALVVSSEYRPSLIRDLKMTEVSRLVQFNPHALFVLAGLSFQETSKSPFRLIKEYNTDKGYQKKVFARFQEFHKMLQQRKTCAPEKEKPGRGKVNSKGKRKKK